MLVHFNAPLWIGERWGWWKLVDRQLDSVLGRSDVTAEMVDKLKSELEDAVPRVTDQEYEALKM